MNIWYSKTVVVLALGMEPDSRHSDIHHIEFSMGTVIYQGGKK